MAELITSLTLIFVSSAVMLLISEFLDQPAIPAYITAGIAVGIFLDQKQLLGLSQLGIGFLVFIFGLKFDPEKITAVRREALTVNSLQILLIGALSYLFALILGLGILQSFFFSVAATLSSSLVGLELISEEVDRNLIHGRLAEAINLIQDIFAIAAIVVVSSSSFLVSEISFRFGAAILIIVSALVVRKYLFDHIGKLCGGSGELLMFTGISLLTAYISVSRYAGLSIVIGSFAAGISVARFPHNLELLDSMGSLKDFFAAIFFVTIGALLSVPGPLALLMTVSLVFLTSVVKPGLMVTSLIHQGYDPRTSFITGVSLDQVSEFTLIIAIQAWISGTISEPLFHAIILAATVTMTTSAYTKKYDTELFNLLERFNVIESGRKVMPESQVAGRFGNHVILIGYDTQGKRIAEELEKMERDFLVVENDPEKISELRKKGENFVYGNVLNDDTWSHAKMEEAELVISTAPFREVSEKILGLDLEADAILRSGSLEEAEELMEKGALYVIVPEILTAELVREHILGIQSEENYEEELRRRNLLEVRSYLESEEG